MKHADAEGDLNTLAATAWHFECLLSAALQDFGFKSFEQGRFFSFFLFFLSITLNTTVWE